MIGSVIPILAESAVAGDGGLIGNLSTNMGSVTSLVGSMFSLIGSTPVLAVMFTAGLCGIGFRIIRKAKRTSN